VRDVILEDIFYDVDGVIEARGGDAEIREGSIQDGRYSGCKLVDSVSREMLRLDGIILVRR